MNLYLVNVDHASPQMQLTIAVVAKSAAEAIEKFEKINHQHREVLGVELKYVDIVQ